MTKLKELLNYCDASSKEDLIYLSGYHWYFLANKATNEIIDLASSNRMNYHDLYYVKESITSIFKHKQIRLEAMEATSYRLIKRLGPVLYDEPFLKSNIPFHKVVIQC